MNKKAYFFLMDAAFAIVVLIVGFMVITSNRFVDEDEVPVSLVAFNVAELMTTARLGELCPEGGTCSNSQLQSLRATVGIYNFNQTLLDYFGEMKDRAGLSTQMRSLFDHLVVNEFNIDTNVYGIRFLLGSDEVYSSSPTHAESEQLISVKKVTYGYYEDAGTGNVEYWGPYLAEFEVWLE